jgi:hypothetical protein
MGIRDFFDDLSDKIENKVSDTVSSAWDRVDETTDALRDKGEAIISKEVESGKLHPSTIKLATGAAQVSYGMVRGALAVGGIIGHGVSGVLTRQHNPGLKRIGFDFIKHGFEDAHESIQEGAETFKEGLRERRK